MHIFLKANINISRFLLFLSIKNENDQHVRRITMNLDLEIDFDKNYSFSDENYCCYAS